MNTEDRSAANRRVAEFMGWHDEEYENVWQGGVDRYWRLIDHEGCRMEVACCSPEEAWASHNIPDLWADSPEGAAWRESVEFELSENHSVYISLHDAVRQWNEVPRVCRANALHAAVVALEGEGG